VILRPATVADAGAVADVYLAARMAASPKVKWAHTEDEVRAWIRGHLIPHGGMTVAVDGLTLHGYIAVHEAWVDHLFIHPLSWRRGLGAWLLGHAKAARPEGLRLWTFQSNARARAFYERQGFTVDHLTDGSDNEEHEPDVLYVWSPAR
jgi:GNAT superfamily N-acetyltransferase